MEDAPTPARRITRSITVLIESKERDSPLKEVLKTPAHNEKGEKRPPGNVEEEDGDAVDPESKQTHNTALHGAVAWTTGNADWDSLIQCVRLHSHLCSAVAWRGIHNSVQNRHKEPPVGGVPGGFNEAVNK
ncbi:Hypothetical predicted protein [Olea europaea subsp. europaea]|uniref:Uncharacterized protein n=1 Tax=Olea europaea subsp. europaea TaxID=158383 RepID=A0A8S0RNF7_OLEEU|nr:Hypothetical predicted protein [Olea europaea subsp. europaea]